MLLRQVLLQAHAKEFSKRNHASVENLGPSHETGSLFCKVRLSGGPYQFHDSPPFHTDALLMIAHRFLQNIANTYLCLSSVSRLHAPDSTLSLAVSFL